MKKNGARGKRKWRTLSRVDRLRQGFARAAPVVGGSALFIYGLARRDRAGLFIAVAGGGIVFRQIRGNLKALEDVPMLRIEESIIVGCPIEEVYASWRDFSNFPNFMGNIESVGMLDSVRSRWEATIPGTKRKITWQVRLVEEREPERLRWRSVEDAAIYHEGEVLFRRLPNGGGTEVFARIAYEPPTGRLGRSVVSFLNAMPITFVREDLERFKRLLETGGEGEASEGSPDRDRH